MSPSAVFFSSSRWKFSSVKWLYDSKLQSPPWGIWIRILRQDPAPLIHPLIAAAPLLRVSSAARPRLRPCTSPSPSAARTWWTHLENGDKTNVLFQDETFTFHLIECCCYFMITTIQTYAHLWCLHPKRIQAEWSGGNLRLRMERPRIKHPWV